MPAPTGGAAGSQGHNLDGRAGAATGTEPAYEWTGHAACDGADDNHRDDYGHEPPIESSAGRITLNQRKSVQTVLDLSMHSFGGLLMSAEVFARSH